jgi:WD40 repeat protein/uncharacterized coiled-coil protein SlyX
MDQFSLLMSGLRTDKEKKLATALQQLIMRINDKEIELRDMGTTVNQLKLKHDSLEASSRKTKNTLYQEQKLRTDAISDQMRIKAVMAKIQRAVSARLRLLGIDFENITSIGEALDASLRAINSLLAALEEKEELISQMQAEMANLKKTIESQKAKVARLEATVAEQKDTMTNQTDTIAEQKQIIEDLMRRNQLLTDENTDLKAQLKKVREEFAQFQKDTQEQLDALRKTVLQEKETNVMNENRIAELEARIRELEALLAQKKENIVTLEARVKELEEALAAREATIAGQNEEMKEKDAEIERLLEIVNRPKADAAAQTHISGAIDQQLSDYPRLLKEIVALKHLLDKKNKRIRDLEEENKQLMMDMQWLLKRAAAFRRDRSNHTGQVWQMHASPRVHMVATGSTDMTVRLWKVNPTADKKQKEKISQVFRRSEVDGKVESLCWSRDGSMLACGTGFRDGAEGYIVVWSMEGNTAYEVLHAIRSRPTTRFGRAMAICFSPNNEFVFAGDTVGSIWCFNLATERIVGLLQCHTDVVHDLVVDPQGFCIYSVGLDMALAVCELAVECGGNPIKTNSNSNSNNDNDMPAADVIQATKKMKKSKRSTKKKGDKKGDKKDKHARTRSKTVTNNPRSSQKADHQSFTSMSLKELLNEIEDDEYKTYEGVVLSKDPKYAYWKVDMTADGKHVCCATRKPHVYAITGRTTVESGPNISDTDMEHIRSLHLRKNMVLITRAGCTRAKLFDAHTGKQIRKMQCKVAVAQADFLFDDAHVVILQQELIANEAPREPKMTLYCYDKSVRLSGKISVPSTPRATQDDTKEDV